MRRHLAWTITSSDSSQQRAQTFEAGGGRIIARCPFRVKLRRTQYEYMSSALPSNSDIARRSRHFAFVPDSDIVRGGDSDMATFLALRPMCGETTTLFAMAPQKI